MAVVPLVAGAGRLAMQALPYLTAATGFTEGAKEGGLMGGLLGAGAGYGLGRFGLGKLGAPMAATAAAALARVARRTAPPAALGRDHRVLPLELVPRGDEQLARFVKQVLHRRLARLEFPPQLRLLRLQRAPLRRRLVELSPQLERRRKRRRAVKPAVEVVVGGQPGIQGVRAAARHAGG